jgi:hypothetical protein
MTYYKVSCTATSGLMGTRTAYLKENGKVFVTKSKKKAEREVEKYNKSMNTVYSIGYFRAKVVKID